MKSAWVLSSVLVVVGCGTTDEPPVDMGAPAMDMAASSGDMDTLPDLGARPDMGTLRDEYALEGDRLHPEGIAFDGTSRRFFFGSLSEGTLFALAPDGTQSVFAESPGEGTSTFGLAVDETRRVLWACSQPPDAADSDAVRRYDLSSGALIGTTALADVAADAQCNDLVADASGAVYVTDPASPRLYRVGPEGAASLFLEDDALVPTVPSLGANGIALSDDGVTLFVAYFSPAALFRVPVLAPERITTIALDGDAFEGLSPLSGPDGLAMHRGALVAVFDDAVHRVTLGPDATTGTVRSVPLGGLSGLSTAAVAEGELYVSKSEVFAFVLGREPELPFQILRIAE
ncbi:MAG: SMP-30/gluconolactonase/LRE family protein [Myxococcota bacterium]